MRKELMSVAHATHIGIEGCLRRVRECLFWPMMASDVKDYVSKCDVCLAHRTSQTKEPLLQHEVVARPWAKLAADLCELHGLTLLVVSDYFSNYIEVARLSSTTTQAVVRELKTIFARFGIPEILVTDNGPQFSSNGSLLRECSRRVGLSIMSLHRLATLSQMARLRTLCGQ